MHGACQPAAHHFADLAQRDRPFGVGVMAQALFAGLQHGGQRVVQAQGDDEGVPKAGLVGAVERGKACHGLGAQGHQSKARLLGARIGRHGAGLGFPPGQFGVHAQQGDLLWSCGVVDALAQRFEQRRKRREWRLHPGTLHHPGRMLHDAA